MFATCLVLPHFSFVFVNSVVGLGMFRMQSQFLRCDQLPIIGRNAIVVVVVVVVFALYNLQLRCSICRCYRFCLAKQTSAPSVWLKGRRCNRGRNRWYSLKLYVRGTCNMILLVVVWILVTCASVPVVLGHKVCVCVCLSGDVDDGTDLGGCGNRRAGAGGMGQFGRDGMLSWG